jgi:hypothetical protein
MKNKGKYYQLDEIGRIGSQEEISDASRKYHKKKTGEIFRQARAARLSSKSSSMKKAS